MNILGSWGEGKLPTVQKSPISLHESGMNKQSAIVESVIVFARRRYFIVIAHGAHFDNFPAFDFDPGALFVLNNHFFD